MSIGENLKHMLEEFEIEKMKLEKLESFIQSGEFKIKTDETQKEIIMKKAKVLKNYCIGSVKKSL